MDPREIWREDYHREVEEELEQMRAEKPKASAGPAATASLYRDLLEALQRMERLTPLFEETRTRLQERSQELEAEIHRREALKEVALNLQQRIKGLDLELQAANQQARLEALKYAQAEGELTAGREECQKLLSAAKAKEDRIAELESEIRRLEVPKEDAPNLQQRIKDLDVELQAARQQARLEALKYAQAESELTTLREERSRQMKILEAKVMELESFDQSSQEASILQKRIEELEGVVSQRENSCKVLEERLIQIPALETRVMELEGLLKAQRPAPDEARVRELAAAVRLLRAKVLELAALRSEQLCPDTVKPTS